LHPAQHLLAALLAGCVPRGAHERLTLLASPAETAAAGLAGAWTPFWGELSCLLQQQRKQVVVLRVARQQQQHSLCQPVCGVWERVMTCCLLLEWAAGWPGALARQSPPCCYCWLLLLWPVLPWTRARAV
jgi:hypothetical protein